MKVREYQNRVDRLRQQSEYRIMSLLQLYRSRLGNAASTLNAFSPLQTLSRGYSITSGADGQAITSADSVSVDDLISTRLHIGRLVSRVEKIIKD